MRIAVIGASGQMGTDIVIAARNAGCDVVALSHAECDVTDRKSLEKHLRPLGPGDAVVNTAAFHRVDECEILPARAMDINGLGAQAVASVARDRGAAIVFLSSDYVFDGAKKTPYVESDVPRPINVYGVSKLAGEMLVRHSNPFHYIARISAVFGVAGSSGKGGNFVETMLAKARRGERIEVVDDIVMAPTYAADAAALLVAVLTVRAPFGVYHLANAGSCSWHDFANATFEIAHVDTRAVAIASNVVAGSACRPAYSVVASERLAPIGLSARPWRDALAAYLESKGHVRAAAAN